MPIVDIEEISKKKKTERPTGIESKEINGKTYFRGSSLSDWYDNYTECVNANAMEAKMQHYKKLGLNEHGQTKEQIAINKAVAELVEDRQKIVDELQAMDLKIARTRRGEVEKKSKKK